MSCTDFPSTGLTPNVTTHTVGSVTYRWTGVAWESQVNVPWEDVLTNQQTNYLRSQVCDDQAYVYQFQTHETREAQRSRYATPR